MRKITSLRTRLVSVRFNSACLVVGASLAVLLSLPASANNPIPQPVEAAGPAVVIGEPVTPREFVGDLRQLPQIQPGERSLQQRPAALPDLSPEIQSPTLAMPGPLISFPGLDKAGGGGGYLNPDTVGDVGPNHYLQAVNLAFGIFNKTGTLLAATTFQSLWMGAGTGTACDSNPRFTPLVVYDPLADRWIVSVLATSSVMNGPYYQCFAMSKTGDPVSGGWWLYAIRADDDAHPYFIDLPKLGIWSDGLYMAANLFDCLDNQCLGSTYKDGRVWAFNLSRMESGLSAQSVLFDVSTAYSGLLPSNLRGILPPTGTPNYFIANDSSTYGLDVWKFHIDWVTPSNSTFMGPVLVPTASYPALPLSVPQSGGNPLSTNSDGLTMQNQYRNIGGVESLWVTHNAGTASGVMGVRWYQLAVTGVTTPSLVQSQTYQPDSTHRWIPSLAVDKDGNMAVGYSVSSASIYPGIRYAGRLAGDPPGTLTQGEATLISGTGAQNTGFSRWGIYSAMSIDPVDNCTFWYTNEYYATTGNNWQTRIGSFRFPSCTSAGATVGTGTPDSCTEAALGAALVGGGAITFNCGAAPHTIPFDNAKSIVANTTINGGGTITLSGQDTTRLFDVSNGAALVLRNIVLTNGFSRADGGAIRNGAFGSDAPGSVTLENSVIRNSRSGLSGGAIVSTGPLTITNSLLENNEALNGGALYPRFAGARTAIISSTLRYNKAISTTYGWGGAMLMWDGAQVTLQGSDVYSNTAALSGGGLYVFANSTLTLNNSTLRDNKATGTYGGGLYNAGAVSMDDVTLSGNRSTYGGGIWNDIAANLWAWNSTIDGNSSISDGGGLLNFGTANLYNVTISHNVAGEGNESAALGGGVFNNSGATLNTRNTLLAGNHVYSQSTTLVLNDCFGEIWSDHSRFTVIPNDCIVTGPSSFPANPNGIGPLADNGGPTLTVALLPGSDAIDAADPVQGCVNMNGVLLTDQRGAPRVVGTRCDVGAYEFGSLLPRLFLPLVIR